MNHGENVERKSWKARRAEKREFSKEDPAVVIIGAGQSGLALAARFGQLGVDTLLIEQVSCSTLECYC